MKILAILQNAWTGNPICDMREVRMSKPSFQINPNNYTGKKLYKLTEGHELWVTNSTPVLSTHANGRRKPDPEFVKKAMVERDYDLYLVCGSQAAATVRSLDQLRAESFLIMPHPAARNFTNKLMSHIKHCLNEGWFNLQFFQNKDSFVVVRLDSELKEAQQRIIFQS